MILSDLQRFVQIDLNKICKTWMICFLKLGLIFVNSYPSELKSEKNQYLTTSTFLVDMCIL